MKNKVIACSLASVMSMGILTSVSVNTEAFDPTNVVRNYMYDVVDKQLDKKMEESKMANALQGSVKDAELEVNGYVEALITKDALNWIAEEEESELRFNKDYKARLNSYMILKDNMLQIAGNGKIQDEKVITFNNVLDIENKTLYSAFPELIDEVGVIKLTEEMTTGDYLETINAEEVDEEAAKRVMKRYIDLFVDNLEYSKRETQDVVIADVKDTYLMYGYNFDIASYYNDFVVTFKNDKEFEECFPDVYAEISEELEYIDEEIGCGISLDEQGLPLVVDDSVVKYVEEQGMAFDFTFAFDNEDLKGIGLYAVNGEEVRNIELIGVEDLLSEGNNYGYKLNLEMQSGSESSTNELVLSAKHESLNKVTGVLDYSYTDKSMEGTWQLMTFETEKEKLSDDFNLSVNIDVSPYIEMSVMKEVTTGRRSGPSEYITYLLYSDDELAKEIEEQFNITADDLFKESEDGSSLRSFVDISDVLTKQERADLYNMITVWKIDELEEQYGDLGLVFELNTKQESMQLNVNKAAVLMGYLKVGLSVSEDYVSDIVMPDGNFIEYETFDDFADGFDSLSIEERLTTILNLE